MKTTIELDIPKSAAERIALEDEHQLFTAAARIAGIAEPTDPHARTELMQAIVNLAKTARAHATRSAEGYEELLAKLQRGDSVKGFSPREEVLLIDAVRRATAR